MAVHGKLSEFDPQKEDWISYSERLQAYFAANKIENGDKKKAILLSVVGAETYQLMQSLVPLEKPVAKGSNQVGPGPLPANSVSDRAKVQVQLSHSEIRRVNSYICC